MDFLLVFSLQSTRKLRPQRKTAGSRNPLKKLMHRVDLQTEYTEVRNDVAEKEMQRIKKEQSKFFPQIVT